MGVQVAVEAGAGAAAAEAGAATWEMRGLGVEVAGGSGVGEGVGEAVATVAEAEAGAGEVVAAADGDGVSDAAGAALSTTFPPRLQLPPCTCTGRTMQVPGGQLLCVACGAGEWGPAPTLGRWQQCSTGVPEQPTHLMAPMRAMNHPHAHFLQLEGSYNNSYKLTAVQLMIHTFSIFANSSSYMF